MILPLGLMLMRILTILFVIISCNLFASSDWVGYWISAQESFENNNLIIAEEDFNSAIEIMESNLNGIK